MKGIQRVSGRVKHWWMAPLMQDVGEGDEDREKEALAMEEEGEEGGIVLCNEEHYLGAYPPIMLSPTGSVMGDDEAM